MALYFPPLPFLQQLGKPVPPTQLFAAGFLLSFGTGSRKRHLPAKQILFSGIRVCEGALHALGFIKGA